MHHEHIVITWDRGRSMKNRLCAKCSAHALYWSSPPSMLVEVFCSVHVHLPWHSAGKPYAKLVLDKLGHEALGCESISCVYMAEDVYHVETFM